MQDRTSSDRQIRTVGGLDRDGRPEGPVGGSQMHVLMLLVHLASTLNAQKQQPVTPSAADKKVR